MERKAIILLVCAWLSVLSAEAGINLIQDGSFEIGVAEGTNNAYYNLGGQTIWRAWPYIGFQVDTTQKHSGKRSLKLYYENYGSASFQPTFRYEGYPSLENATYILSFYYKTDIDRSSESFHFDIREGVQGNSTPFFSQSVPIDTAAKDGFVYMSVQFSTNKAMTSFIPYINVSFMAPGVFLYIDDFSLTKVVDAPEAWGPVPDDGAANVKSTTTLAWQNGKGAKKHNVYLGTDSLNMQVVAQGITGNEIWPDTLRNEIKYFWRVDEVDSLGNVAIGATWRFTTMSFYEEYMHRLKTEQVVSEHQISWKQFGPGNSGFVNFLRYHPLLPDVCITSPDMYNTYITEDNGTSWKTVKDIDGQGDFSRLYDLYFSTKNAAFGLAIENSRLYVSQDTGRSWQNIKWCPWYNSDAQGNETRSWHRKVSAIAIDPANDDIWYVGAGNFPRGQQPVWGTIKTANINNPRGDDSEMMGVIWRTTDAGKNWTALSNGLNPKDQFCRIIVHPNNSNIVFAASKYGLYRSVDAGATWQDIGTGKLDNNTIMDMDSYYDASTSVFNLYVADQVRYLPNGTTTKCTGGIFVSKDNGDTWQNINGNLYLDINQLTGGVPGNYYQYIARWFQITKQDAQTKYPVLPTKALQYFNSLNVHPGKQDGLVVGFYDAQTQYSIIPGRLWKTTDGGSNWVNTARVYGPAWEADKAYWTARNNPYNDNIEMGHQPSEQQWGQNYPLRSLRYCAVNTRGDIMILFAHNTLLSTDQGASWHQVDEDYTAAGNIMGRGNSNLPGQCLYQDKRLGEGIVYLGSGEHHLWRSANDGTDGRQAATYLNGSQESVFAVTTHPWDEQTVFTTSMRQKDLDRIYKSTDGGATFVDWGQATQAVEWMKTNNLRIDPIHPDNMYFGVTEVAGSGGGSGTGGPDKDKEGGFHKSSDAGKSFAPSNTGMPAKVWVRDIEFDPRDDTRASLFAAAPWNAEVKTNGGLFHSSDYGNTWSSMTLPGNIEGVNNIAFDHTGRMYITAGRRGAALNGGGVWYSDDYGQTWVQIFDMPFVECIDISPFDDHLIIISDGILTKNPGIYLSEDRGKTWHKNNRIIGQPDKITQVEFDLHDPATIWMSHLGSGFYRGYYPGGADKKIINISPGTYVLPSTETLKLSVTTTGPLGTLKYKSANDAVATVSPEGVVTPTGIGATKIWVTSEDGRYADFLYLVVEKGTITGLREEIDTTAFPNPTQNVIYLKGVNEGTSYQLIDMKGRVIAAGMVDGDKKVNLAGVQPGLYLLRTHDRQGSRTFKILKEE